MDGIYATSKTDRFIMVAAIAIASIGLGYLFFTQLWWKVPPTFSCNEGFETGGLCNWVEREASNAEGPRQLFKANIVRTQPGPELSIPAGWATSLNGAFLENVVQPNIRWFGWVIWGTESFIVLSLVLGFFSRLGALAAVGMATQLTLGLAGTPGEWEWSYQLILLLAIAVFGIAPGRYFGLDRLLRPRLKMLSERGSRAGRLLLLFT